MWGKRALVTAVVSTALGAGAIVAQTAGADLRAGSIDRGYGQSGTGVVNATGFARGFAFGRTGDVLTVAIDSVSRLTPAGRPDRSYGVGGTAVLPGRSLSDLHLVRLADGGLVLAAASGGAFPPEAIVVTKLRADGRPDTSFGGDGSIDYPPTNFAFNEIRTAAVNDDGRVFVGGNTDRGPATLRRIERNGALTSNSCADVPAVQTFPGDRIEASAARGNQVLVAGTGIDLTTFQRGTRIRVVDSCGRTLRSTLVLDPPGRFFSAQSAVVDGDGWLIGNAEGLLKVRADGSADATFGSDGYVFFDELGGVRANMQTAVVDRAGRVVMSGSSAFAVDAVPVTIRLRADGTLDPAYGNGGAAPVFGLPVDVLSAGVVGLAPEGRILVATSWFLPDATMASSVSRYVG